MYRSTSNASYKSQSGKLYLFVIAAIFVGICAGYAFPDAAPIYKIIGDLFIRLIKMMIGPIVFVTVVTGIAKMGSLREVGRIGIKALIYFEIVSTIALVVGLVVGNLIAPGKGLNVDPASLDTGTVSAYIAGASKMRVDDFLLHMVPETFLGGLANGDVLQVLILAIFVGTTLVQIGERAAPVVGVFERIQDILFGVINSVMYFAPIGAFGAIAFTVGKYGIGSLQQLGTLMLCFYLTCAIFVFGILGLIGCVTGFNIWRLLVYIREEILLVLGTSTSETALPRLMLKLEDLGISRPIVGLVVPTGYSFNLDGIAIYLTMGALFIAQATNTSMSIGEQVGLLAILLLTSKGSAAVTGAGFVTLAATLAATHALPVAGLALLVGIDRFMSEARAITNMIGNAVACIAVAAWEKGIDRERMAAVLAGKLRAGSRPATDTTHEAGEIA